jgi:hypothetical protein
MSLEIKYIAGNNYRIHDAFVVAEAELLGGGGGMAINLRSIRAADPTQSRPETDISEAALISYLEKGLIELRRYRSFIVAYNGMVVASTDAEAPKGSRIPTKIIWQPRI